MVTSLCKLLQTLNKAYALKGSQAISLCSIAVASFTVGKISQKSLDDSGKELS